MNRIVPAFFGNSFWPAMMRFALLGAALLATGVAHGQLRVYCWGNPSAGITNVPPGLANVRAIAAGYNHCLVLFSNGTVTAWGDNSAGQTNLPNTLTNIVAIAAGEYHNLFLRSNGTVAVYGGFNNNGEWNVPAGLSGVKAIAAGGAHNLVLRTNGTVVAWGRNFNGETNVPAGLNGVMAIAAGDTHSLALRTNGAIVAWGDNGSGQLNTPAGLTNALLLAAGYHHNLAVRTNGTVAAWELNVYGETDVPPGLSNVVGVAAGHFFSAAIRGNGTVAAWGQDFSGQTNVPPGLTNVIAIAAGSDHMMALSGSPICSPGFPDNFECRQALVGTNLTFISSNLGATREPGEPPHFSGNSSNSLWYTWTAPVNGALIFRADGPSGGGYFKPIIAIYTGNNLSNLVAVAANSTAGNGSGGPSIARAVAGVMAGQVYQIAVDGDGQGTLTNNLSFAPPPENDLFANAGVIAGFFYSNSASFLGSSREAGEPTHGAAQFGQTLWWTWTVPTNAPNPVSVRLLADAVSFPPAIRVYTGASLGSLTPVPLTLKTNGMTSDAVFDAAPGSTYRIALAGTANDPNSASPLIGTYHFRLNTRALALSITNLVTLTNGNGSIGFQADALVENRGNAASGPLRVSLSAVSGVSTVRALTNAPASTVTNLLTTNVTASLAIGSNVIVHLAGTAPAPNANDSTSPIAYGVYAELQEQPVSNAWFTVDQTLVTYDNWPGVGQIFGPGGGVIRLDPGYGSGTSFNSISNVVISGSSVVLEGASTNYFGRVTFANGTTQNFTNTVWLASMFNIGTNGVFTSGSVTSNTIVSIGLVYSYAGITSYAFTNVTVLNGSGSMLASPHLLGSAGFVFTIVGVPGSTNIVEAATNLTPPITWVAIATNAASNGIVTVTNFSRTNFPARFYRSRER